MRLYDLTVRRVRAHRGPQDGCGNYQGLFEVEPRPRPVLSPSTHVLSRACGNPQAGGGQGADLQIADVGGIFDGRFSRGSTGTQRPPVEAASGAGYSVDESEPMTETLAHRPWLHTPLLCALAAAYGGLIAIKPLVAAGLAVVLLVVALAFLAPVTHLAILLFLTTIVPYSLSNRYLGLSTGPGVLLSDLFLFTGLASATVALTQAKIGPRGLMVLGSIVALCVWVVFAAYSGVRQGRNLSDVGLELRELGGYSAALIAMAVLLRRGASARLGRALLMLGLLLGLWGLVQWLGGLQFEAVGDFGVREGVSYASGARGQVQGGLFAFPVAIIVSTAVLASGELRGRPTRLAVGAVLALNAVSLLLTFERTFWLVTALGIALVILRAGRARRARALLTTATIVIIGLAATSALSPDILQAASSRLLSVGQYGSDNSLRYRSVESRHVLREIGEAPIVGSGLGASIWWGRPWDGVLPTTETYSHNGYFRLVWRLGLLGAGMLLLPLLLSIRWRASPERGGAFASIRVGGQVSLLALLIASALFPVFTGYGITTAIGVLVGICALPRPAFPTRQAAHVGAN